MIIQELESVDDEQMESSLPMLCDAGRDLMRQLMRAEPTDRITAADALSHHYFESIHHQCAVVGKYLPQSRPPPCKFLDIRAHRAWVRVCALVCAYTICAVLGGPTIRLIVLYY